MLNETGYHDYRHKIKTVSGKIWHSTILTVMWSSIFTVRKTISQHIRAVREMFHLNLTDLDGMQYLCL